jgi:hypothetical protein
MVKPFIWPQCVVIRITLNTGNNLVPFDRIQTLIWGEGVVHVPDVQKDPRFLSDPRWRERTEIGGVQSLLAVALHKDDALLGTLTVYRQEVQPFSDKQIALLQNFAAQAVIAMENARLLTETREALEQQTATAEVLQVINSSPGDLAPVFEALLDKATGLCNAGFGILQIYDGDRFHAVALHNVPTAFAEFAREPWRPRSGGNWARLLAGEPVIHEADMADSDDYRNGTSPDRRVRRSRWRAHKCSRGAPRRRQIPRGVQSLPPGCEAVFG